MSNFKGTSPPTRLLYNAKVEYSPHRAIPYEFTFAEMAIAKALGEST